MPERAQRVGMNESVFREVNERIEGLNRAVSDLTGTMSIVCECGAADCTEQIEIALREYEHLRADPALFAVVPGHEASGVEDIVDRREHFDIVRKHPGVPETIAKATDPRALE